MAEWYLFCLQENLEQKEPEIVADIPYVELESSKLDAENTNNHNV